MKKIVEPISLGYGEDLKTTKYLKLLKTVYAEYQKYRENK